MAIISHVLLWITGDGSGRVDRLCVGLLGVPYE